MKGTTLILISLFLATYSFAQPFRYAEIVFQQNDTLKAVEYARAEWLNNPVALLSDYNIHDGETKTEERPLLMDIFMPHGDTVSKRPAIIFVHGGAFLLGSRYNDDMVAFCDSFARRGYVTATIDYRLGMGASVTRFLGIPINIQVTPANASRAVYRGIQDGRAAIRFLKHNATIYGIDTTKIYMLGSSAGGFVALQNIYYNEDVEIPPEVFQKPSLGGLDSIGVAGYNAKADAIVSLWGAVQNPGIIQDESTPAFLVHGEADDIVPFKNGIPLKDAVPPNPIVGFSMPETFGSYCVDTTLTSRGIFHETYFVPDKKHEFYGCDTGEFPDEGPNHYWDTINWKVADFLLDRFRPNADFETEINGIAVNFINHSSDSFITEWNFGDGDTSDEIHPYHEYNLNGRYIVRLTTCNQNLACDTISKTIEVDYVYGINEPINEEISIYPNPVKNIIHIQDLNSPFEIKLFDIWGRQYFSKNMIDESSLDVGDLKPGLYLLELKLQKVKVVRKFLKID